MKRTKGGDGQDSGSGRGQKQIPTPEHTLKQLAPLLAILFALLEEGVAEAHEYFQQKKYSINRPAFAMLVRLSVFQKLEAATTTANLKCRVVKKANVGIGVRVPGATINIWKADKDGKLPPCGESSTRQSFYTQARLPEIYGGDGLPPKLALLWESNGGPLALKLVAPRGFKTLWTPGEAHWEIDVPHPAKAVTVKTDLTSDAEELDDILKHKKTADEPNDKT